MWMWMGPWMVNGWVVREVSRELWIGDFISGLWFATWGTPTPVLWNRFQRRLWMVGWLGGPLVGRGGRESKQPVAVRWQGPNSDTQPAGTAVQYKLTNTNGRETKSANCPPLTAAAVLVFLCGKHFKTLWSQSLDGEQVMSPTGLAFLLEFPVGLDSCRHCWSQLFDWYISGFRDTPIRVRMSVRLEFCQLFQVLTWNSNDTLSLKRILPYLKFWLVGWFDCFVFFPFQLLELQEQRCGLRCDG